VELPAAAGAGLVLDIDNLLDARQVRGKRAAVGAVLPDPVSALGGISRFLAGEALGLDLLGSTGRLSARRPKRWRCSSLMIWRSRSFSARSAASIA
jgi:hypothetical protein